MITSLKIISLLFATAIPSTVFAELIGVHLPAALDPSRAFGAFFVVIILLTAFADYSNTAKSLALNPSSTEPQADIAHFPQRTAVTRLAA